METLVQGQVVRVNPTLEDGIVSRVDGEKVLVLTMPGLMSTVSTVYKRTWYSTTELTATSEIVAAADIHRWFRTK